MWATVKLESPIPSSRNKTDMTDRTCSFGIPTPLERDFSKTEHVDFNALHSKPSWLLPQDIWSESINKLSGRMWRFSTSFKIVEACDAVVASEVRRPKFDIDSLNQNTTYMKWHRRKQVDTRCNILVMIRRKHLTT